METRLGRVEVVGSNIIGRGSQSDRNSQWNRGKVQIPPSISFSVVPDPSELGDRMPVTAAEI